MVIENDPSARMQMRTLGELMHPACCMVCGNGNFDEGYLDLGVFYQFEGTMYLCGLCIRQAGETYGLYTPEEVKSQQELIERLSVENAKYKEELNDYRPIIDSISDLLGVKFVDPSDPASIAAYQVPETIKPDVDETSTESAAGESVTEEPVKVSGRSNASRSKPRDVKF